MVEAMPRWRMTGTGTFSTAVVPAARQSRVSLTLPSGCAATAEKWPAVDFVAASAASAALAGGRRGAGAGPGAPSRSTTLTWRAMGCSGDAPLPAPRVRHSICAGNAPGVLSCWMRRTLVARRAATFCQLRVQSTRRDKLIQQLARGSNHQAVSSE